MIKTSPLVSIMIPVYNRESIISQTLDCAINQTYKNIEIIVSDNCSTDNTWSILKDYAEKDTRIKIFKNEINLGPVLNWKVCIDNLNGEYTKILWSDDLISTDFIEKTLTLFDDETAFVMSGVRVFNSVDNRPLNQSKFQTQQVYTKKEFFNNVLFFNTKKFPVSPGCAIFRTKDILSSYVEQIPNVENLDFKRFGAGNDLLFFLITASKYKYVKTINEISSFFRSHPSSLSISNKLILYYEYAKAFFVNNYFDSLSTDYKCKLYLFKKYNNEYCHLYDKAEGQLKYGNLFVMFFKMLASKASKILK